MGVRQFKLINEFNKEIDFNGVEIFGNTPEGLGTQFNISKTQINGTTINYAKEINNPPISFQLVFDSYKLYKIFRTFVTNSQNLKLLYDDTVGEEFIDVTLQQIDKTEIDPKTKKLLCKTIFDRLTNFYQDGTVLLVSNQASSGKMYNYTYGYNYGIVKSGENIIPKKGNVETPAIIKFNAPYSNPILVFTDIYGNIVTQFKLNKVDQTIGNYAVIDATYDNLQAYDNAGNNLYTNIERTLPGYSTFIYLPPKLLKVKVMDELANFGDIEIAYRDEWV